MMNGELMTLKMHDHLVRREFGPAPAAAHCARSATRIMD
jgi:hypothetical protein